MKPKKLPQKEAKDSEVQRLKRRIKRLEKERDQLKSEIKTLESFRDLTIDYVDGKLEGVPVEKVIRGIDKKQKLDKIKKPDVIKEICTKCLKGELKRVPYRSGVIIICGNCEHRETKKE
jgi:predicted RNase H-like nuclease (RuvC/YqgF family)